MNTHTLSVLVENKPGVLARISGLFARRGYNIESLAVGPTENDEFSRITVQVAVSSQQVLEQIIKQLNKLIEVLKIVELEEGSSVRRELVLIKVKADPATRSQIIEIVSCSAARPSTSTQRRDDHRSHRLPGEAGGPAGDAEPLRRARNCAIRPGRAWSRWSVVVGSCQDREDPSGRPGGQLIRSEKKPMAELFYDADADLSVIQGRNVAVIGYAARVTPMRCRCVTPELTCGSACAKAPRAGPRLRPKDCGSSPRRRPPRKPI